MIFGICFLYLFVIVGFSFIVLYCCDGGFDEWCFTILLAVLIFISFCNLRRPSIITAWQPPQTSSVKSQEIRLDYFASHFI